MITPHLIYASIKFDLPNNPTARKFQHIHNHGLYYEDFVPVPRSGNGPNPWNIKTMPEHKIPWPEQPYLYNFEETTDYRAQELAQTFKQNNEPIVFFWSGGIDSTVALCGMIRNFDAELMNRVVIKMNAASYIENPYFFENHIRNKIAYDNSPFVFNSEYNIVDGGMADPLWIQRDIISMDLWRPKSTTQNVITQPDDLLTWLTNKCGKEHATWFYELVVESGINSGIELIDYEDFYWWWNFNNCYACQHYKSIECSDITNITHIDLPRYFTNVLPWYSSKFYQQWSLSNRSNGIKYQGSLRSYKMVAKDYIFSVDKNPWYRDYKTKTGSPGHIPKNFMLGIYDNGEILIG